MNKKTIFAHALETDGLGLLEVATIMFYRNGILVPHLKAPRSGRVC